MATISKSNNDNFLIWQKVKGGSLPLSQLQEDGLPPPFFSNDFNSDFNNDFNNGTN